MVINLGQGRTWERKENAVRRGSESQMCREIIKKFYKIHSRQFHRYKFWGVIHIASSMQVFIYFSAIMNLKSLLSIQKFWSYRIYVYHLSLRQIKAFTQSITQFEHDEQFYDAELFVLKLRSSFEGSTFLRRRRSFAW